MKAVKAKKGNKNNEKPLKVNGTFMDIMKAAVKHRDKNVKEKKKP